MKMNEEYNRDFKGVWIPRELWLRDDLNILEKCIFVEIDSLDNENHCIASNKYFANFCQCSESKVTNAINKLQDLKMIEVMSFDGRHRKIRVVKSTRQTHKKYEADSQKVRTNNINNNTSNKVISKDINTSNPGKSSTSNSFIGSAKSKNKKSPNLYESCINLIDDFIITNHCEEIRHILIQHLDIAMEQKRIRGRTQYKGILNKLVTIKNNSGVSYEDIIMYSIEHGYPTFYMITTNNNNKRINETGKRHVESFTEEDQKRLDEFKEKCRREGKQVEF